MSSLEMAYQFQAQTSKLNQTMQRSAASVAQMSAALKALGNVQTTPPPPTKGVKQTLGYPGPPSHGKFRRDDRVRDCKGDIWECVRGGKPGTWTRES